MNSQLKSLTTALPTFMGQRERAKSGPITLEEGRRLLDQRMAEFEPWKRIADIGISVVALTVLAPLVALVAVLVKLTSPGPVFFSQERIGVNRRGVGRRGMGPENLLTDRRRQERRSVVKFGKPFIMYKFRTMVVEAETGQPVWAQEQDPRVTLLGRLLRKAHIDEIPQFINVIKGDMSVVGPRPERAYFIGETEKEIPDFQLRLRAKPGITGLAQVRLGYTNTLLGLSEKLYHDIEYIARLSPVNDLRILLRTISVVFTGKGAC